MKIDRAFIAQMLVDAKQAKLVEAIIQMGHSLGLTIIAEGIEQTMQQQRLQSLGCDYLQGYYFSKPLTREAFQQYLAEKADFSAQ